ncbi:nuclear transport factor 2 family protein [Abyssibius alkaniclasticus]|uniref:YybH family protein n=1 Tax=Abyssibius alkaniclasticus TaxID=2881234 RepID=UPI002363287F|nr:nuclear transport factor 2 family protein [Abyssibius alkaniclasticus]UPH71158.1 nuclear transport factor 2 family protein [Abyssibius alkaniclasticus]
MTSKDEIRQASSRFYDALNSMAHGDANPMRAIWAHSPDATAQHPIGGRDMGSETVLGSFAKVAAIAEGGEIALTDQHIDMAGDMAVETGIEAGSITLAGHTAAINQRVTNVYRRADGGWKIQHHHTDVAPAMLDILAKLAPPA